MSSTTGNQQLPAVSLGNVTATGASMITHSARDEITRTNSLTSPLLHLPAELRSKIFLYALSGNVIEPTWDGPPIGMSFPTKASRDSNSQPLSQLLSLGSVCRQTRAEAPLVLASNIFHFVSAFQADVVADSLSPEQHKCVTTLAVSREYGKSLLLAKGLILDGKFWLCKNFGVTRDLEFDSLERVVMPIDTLESMWGDQEVEPIDGDEFEKRKAAGELQEVVFEDMFQVVG